MQPITVVEPIYGATTHIREQSLHGDKRREGAGVEIVI